MSNVVQGVVVNEPYNSGGAGNVSKGEKQPNRCRDPIFAVLFYLNLFAIVGCAVVFGPTALQHFSVQGVEVDTQSYMTLAGVCAIFALALSGLMLTVMMCIAEFLIKVALLFEVALSGAFAVYSFMIGSVVGGVIGLIFFLIGCCYARAVWSRIPFATANLRTSLTAIRANYGVAFVGYFFAILSVGWYLLWVLVFVGVWVTLTCDQQTNVCAGAPNGGILFGLFLSFFFANQVLQNCVNVTVAGTVGTWWFSPDEASFCCSSAVIGSTFRTLTTSFGSICFGSLIVAIIQALRQTAYAMRDGDNNILMCIADCILSCIESIVEYFNKWAYVYVGLYGYSYMEAGKNVFTLFKNRGWEAVIADDLVSNVLFLVSLVVGLISGGVGVALMAFTDLFPELNDNSSFALGFAFGFLVGLVLTSILMSVVAGGVNTVIVCFAEGPAEFQQNHPELSNKMRDAWMKAYPGSV